jgi:hypothetical protein
MNCAACQERRQRVRDAWIAGRIAEAVKQTALGAAEMSGLKPKESRDGMEGN